MSLIHGNRTATEEYNDYYWEIRVWKFLYKD